ncbi:hypothetical protein LINGRAHAP2_LOCUS8491 [Linum grandiflorum]
MTTTRGKIGYIAPKVFSQNFGAHHTRPTFTVL